MTPRFSIVILTFARDPVLAETLARLREKVAARGDYEVLLVDNNPDRADRERLLEGFAATRYFWDGVNKGVSARNIGIAAAQGDIVIVLDDDVLVESSDPLAVFGALFDADPRLGAVTIAKHVRGADTRRVDLIPHTRKDVDLDREFMTFRFVGGCVGFRTAAIRAVGGFSDQFFYGLEEIELSYRLINAGWTIRYSPAVVVEELEHPSGRRPTRAVQTDRLVNKYIMSWLHMPFPHILANYLLFTPYIAYRVKGQVSIGTAIARFVRWLARSDRPRRNPLSPRAVAYIRDCGGALWR
ncbi:glycosyltransferase family 2 protein [Sphingomonas sp. CCH18-H6]|uniref:glycosyltransferase family 2 protein n=1 Tax=Sphingomonas sp. CCH18-H6 TaxID=1768787 RepID=UPI00082FF6CB|nr:glycosyltransferase [Sphingomonas sp. CCH18-H6]